MRIDMKTAVLTLCAVLIWCSAAWSHGDEQHVLGTVTKIEAGTITVSTATGATTVVNIVAATKFVRGGAPATIKDLKVGDRVAIHAKPKAPLEATEVKIGSGPAAQK